MEKEQSPESQSAEQADSPQDQLPDDPSTDRDEGGASGADTAGEKMSASDFDQEVDEARQEIKDLEDDPPQDLDDWPSGRAKYETFGGPEHESSYEESAATKLGDADVRHHEGGKVTVDGEEVDNPEDYKGEPIPGGPTDPDTPKVSGERDLTEEGQGDDDKDGEG